MVFGARGERVAGRGVALNAMVRHDGVDDVFGAPFGHVAAGAVGGRGVAAGGDGAIKLLGVAFAAGGVVVGDGGLAAGDVMGIVAGGAAEGSWARQVGRVPGPLAPGLRGLCAFEEAAGLADAIDGVDEFELVLALSGGGVIEEEPLVRERLAGLVIEGAAIVAGEGVGQGEAGGFKVALHADLVAAVGGEARGVDDGLAKRGGGGTGAGEFDVVQAGAVAALAVDAVG